MSNFPAIPEPQLTLESARESILAIKEAIENIVGTRGPSSTTLASQDGLDAALANLQDLETTLTAQIAALDAAIDALAVPSFTQVDFITGIIAVPTNKDYTLTLKIPFGCTITETTTKSLSGTCTATFKINSTALGGTANSVSSTEQSQSHSSTNVAAAGDDIVLTVSANATCLDLAFTIRFTRTLA